MNTPKRNRARVLTPEGLKKLRQQIRSQETDENAGTKYTLEKLGELTGLDPETVKNVLDCKGSDKRTIARCFESFGLTLAESDHIAAAQAAVAPPDPNFVGREGAIADLDTLVSRNAKVIVIQARGGVGKTTLARKYLQQSFDSFLEFPIAKETKDIASIEGLIEEKLRQLGEEPGREFLVSLDRLKRKLQAERIGILIDNLEPALDSAGRFIEAHRRYVELLRVLSDPTVRSVTLITSRERLREADVTVQHYPLRSLDVTAWEQFFQSRGIDASAPAMAALHNAYGGNAKAMDIISGAVLEDFAGDVEAYWQANQADLFIERDLEDLVIKQFERLQQLDSDAYNLLCRMGCYRYQDVPTVPIEGLFCLLWDVPENRHRRVIKSLQDRSLVDFEDGEYWLHPVIRAEAIKCLKESINWEKSHRNAAHFWVEYISTIETVEDALKAFEAYYHCIENDDFEYASDILLKERENDWLNGSELGIELTCSLASSFIRLGLMQQIISSSRNLINCIGNQCSLIKLYITLGDACWMTGNLLEAIESHENAKSLSINLNQKESRIIALLDIGLCKEDLWEVEEAIDCYKDVILSCDEMKYQRFSAQSKYCLAHLYSHLDCPEEARFYIQEVYKELSEIKLGIRSTGYRLYCLGFVLNYLGDVEKAHEMYLRAIEYAERGKFTQLKALSLIGLGIFYRGQNDLLKAISNHLEGMDLLCQVGARRNCAEGYYQLGLTYQTMSDFEKSFTYFQKAIQLFSEMGAPKQVERVRQSM
jgi:tetratricopeptide (TPR) repeat protein